MLTSRWIGAFCIAAVGVVAVTAAAIGLSPDGVFCASCHRMNANQAAVSSPAHKDLTCGQCHQSVDRWQIVSAGLKGGRPADHGRVSDASCLSCHGEINDTPNYHNTAVTHQKHEEADIRCVSCHQDAGHLNQEQFETMSAMRMCASCHSGSEAQAECGVCHTVIRDHGVDWTFGHSSSAQQQSSICQHCHEARYCSQCHSEVEPRSHKGDWLKMHGDSVGDGTSCATCHKTSSCDTCHGMPMPHPDNWLAGHKRTALKDASKCEHCHSLKYCWDCHKTARPASHTGAWSAKHGIEAAASEEPCLRCHTRIYCSDCHKKSSPASHSTEDWSKTHGQAQNVTSCEMCHGKENTCTACHGGIELPHPSGWLVKHKADASLEPGSNCLKCHDRKDYCGRCHKE